MPVVRALIAAAACMLAAGSSYAAEPPATITLIEGPSALLRGTARYALAEGVRLQSGDIVEVGDKGLAQVEFGDGSALSLGPGSRFYAPLLAPRGAKGGASSEFYLMRGWTKISTGKGAGAFRLTTPVFGLWVAEAIAVLHIGEAEGALFMESGELRLAEGFVKASPASPVLAKGGEYFARKGEQRGVTQPRPAPAFVGAMPRGFRDNLPARAAKWRDREVAPRELGDLAYADVEMWLKAPPEIRRAVMKPFVPKAHDPAFRQALVANLKSHPEWDRILFPEKYRPKPPPERPQEATPPKNGTPR